LTKFLNNAKVIFTREDGLKKLKFLIMLFKEAKWIVKHNTLAKTMIRESHYWLDSSVYPYDD